MDQAVDNKNSRFKGEASYDPVAELYAKAFADYRVRADEWKWIRKQVLKVPRPAVLDYGCGNGALLRLLSGIIQSGRGVDISERLIQKANEANPAGSNLEFVRIDSPILPYQDCSFDLVISVLSFRYLDWDPVISEMKRVLKPCGKILIVDMVERKPKLVEIPAFIIDKLRNKAQLLINIKYARALRELVSHHGWGIMLKRHPIRNYTEYLVFLNGRFPGRSIKTINTGWKSRIIAFDSGKIYPE